MTKEIFTIPNDATPLELNQSLVVCGNQIAMLTDLVAQYKNDASCKEITYKRKLAIATVKNQNAKNAAVMKALAETDDDVIKAADDLSEAEARYTLLKAELDGYETQFIALRKIVEMRKIEIQRGVG